jgi:predicted DNA-binding transcriptional regulator AlpA
MNYDFEKPLFTLTVGEYINLNKQLISTFEKNLNQQQIPTNQEKNEILIEEASIITGLAVSTIRTKCHLNEIPYNKPKGTKFLRFKRDELIAWMNSIKLKTFKEEENDLNQYLISKGKKNKI